MAGGTADNTTSMVSRLLVASWTRRRLRPQVRRVTHTLVTRLPNHNRIETSWTKLHQVWTRLGFTPVSTDARVLMTHVVTCWPCLASLPVPQPTRAPATDAPAPPTPPPRNPTT
eukprot:5169857-Prymnesium_polylepis.2